MPKFDMLSQEELMEMSPLQLAYIGDSVYDLMVRSSLLKNKSKLRLIHLSVTGKVNAVAQARTLHKLIPHLSEEELEYVRRGRNAHSRHPVPKSATSADYSAATGFETLFGYLYVRGREDRLKELYALTEID